MIGHRYLRLVSRNYIHGQADLQYLSYATVAWVDVFTRGYLYSSARDEARLPGMLRLGPIWGAVIAGPVPPMRDLQERGAMDGLIE
jgi:hypothetical protein